MELLISFKHQLEPIVIRLRGKNNEPTGAKFTPKDLEEGAISIARALWGTYKDVNGRSQSVSGDMTQVRVVPGLSDAAHFIVAKYLSYCSEIAWHSGDKTYYALYNSSISYSLWNSNLCHFSPDENHNLLMIRLSRTRTNDPVWEKSYKEVI